MCHSQVGTSVDSVPFTTIITISPVMSHHSCDVPNCGDSQRRHWAGPQQSTMHGPGARSNLYVKPLGLGGVFVTSRQAILTANPPLRTKPTTAMSFPQ